MNRVFVFAVSVIFTATCVADVWTVDDDGKADFDNIQAAIDAASDGDEIIVMPGTYVSAQDGHVVNMLGKAITLRSSDPTDPDIVASTIIDGERNRRGLACFNDETSSTLINGFTITRGYASNFDYNEDEAVYWWEKAGAGMINYQSDATIQNCSFIGNTSSDNAAGMFNYYSNPVLTNCIFQGNSTFTGGGVMNSYSNPDLLDCSFINNTANYGGGMYNTNSNPMLENCVFRNNTAYGGGGGMANYYFSSPTLDACEFTNNIADIGGGIANFDSSDPTLNACLIENNNAFGGGGGIANHQNSNPVISNCDLVSNTAFGYGGGMYNYFNSNPTIENGCSFVNNTSFDAGGGMRNYRSSPTITNCSFTDNSAATYAGGIDNHDFSSPILNTCSFTNNIADYGGGIANYYDSSPSLENCTFNRNTSLYGGALYNQSNSSPSLKNCEMSDNNAFLGAGIYAHLASSVYFDETNTCDSLYFSEVGSTIHLASESVCTVTGSIVPSATGSITFELDDLSTIASLSAGISFLHQGGLSVRNDSYSLLDAQLGDIIPLATVPASSVEFSSKVFPPLADGLGLRLLEQVGATGNESVLSVEVVQVATSQFADPVMEELNNSPIDVISFDIDGDGSDEIAVLFNGWPGEVLTYRVSKNGAPTPIAGLFASVGFNPVDIDVADMDGNGYQDLLVANSTNSTINLLMTEEASDGSLAFTVSSINVPKDGAITCMNVIDWNGTGSLDVVVGIDMNDSSDRDGYQVLVDIVDWEPSEFTGACCRPNLICTNLTFEDCDSTDGFYQGDGSSCDTAPCTASGGWGLWFEVPKYQLPDGSSINDIPTCVDGGDLTGGWGFVGGTRYGRIHRGTFSGELQVIDELGGYNTVTIEAIDLDDGGDDQLDLMVSSDEAETVYLFQGDSAESDGFGDLIPIPVSIPIEDMIALDSDADGDMDIMLCSSLAVDPLILLRNDGTSGMLPTTLHGRTWSKQTLKADYQVQAITSGGLSPKDEEETWKVGVGSQTSFRGVTENIMHQTNIGTTCEGDLDGDGEVSVVELLMIIDQWGQTNSPADIDGDGIVNVTDLLIVVGNWGSCK